MRAQHALHVSICALHAHACSMTCQSINVKLRHAGGSWSLSVSALYLC